ncbi:conserved hypothetical protein [Candidatus Desulfarcum epimagneticum]|uniref:VTC domain-containing protein n=1 Tax=uncultured Desulfobacteraceae bacterium TaxID=218296 RepID=A0A484HGY0_9BACT|nr:conserved hypothetical protein [uncultured Desulfobacteraceae bacterium]
MGPSSAEKAVINIQDEYRYERKFDISDGLAPGEAESIIKIHPAIFSEIFYSRFVNSIYLDTNSMGNYFDNVYGFADRKKIRLRWYGSLFGKIDKPTLEIKIKKGFVGKKKSYPIHGFVLDSDFNIGTFLSAALESGIPDFLKQDLHFFNPVLLNRYSRKYFLSANKKYRITLDTNLSFYKIKRHNNSFLSSIQSKSKIVIELKYESRHDNNADRIINSFPFRVTRNSKYVNGIKNLY